MSCPVCNRTMQSVSTNQEIYRVFWCQYCGTLKECSGTPDKEYVRYEIPGMLRGVIRAASPPYHIGEPPSTGRRVSAEFTVKRLDENQQRIELEIYTASGIRIV